MRFYSALAEGVAAFSGRFAEGVFDAQRSLSPVGRSSVCRGGAGKLSVLKQEQHPSPIPGPLSASQSPTFSLVSESDLFLPLRRERIHRPSAEQVKPVPLARLSRRCPLLLPSGVLSSSSLHRSAACPSRCSHSSLQDGHPF